MNTSQKKKLAVLIAFVLMLVLASAYMYKVLVKPSPYYPQEQTQDE